MTGRAVLVVGASRGIGLEFVRQSIEAGERVVATARDDDGLARLAACGARALRLDVRDAAAVAGLAWQLDGEAFDQVIVNAGVFGPSLAPLQAPNQDDFDLVMRTNVLGPMRVLNAVGDALAPVRGATLPRVAVLSSRMGSMGLRAQASNSLYRASKAALNSVLVDAALALAGRAICVALHPGWVRTDMGGASADLEVERSVHDLRRTLDALTPADSGRFLDHDGTPLAW